MKEFTELASSPNRECELVFWLQSKQPDFSKALELFGRRHNLGIERRRRKYAGQFTGADLCSLAVGIQEEALLRRYGRSVQTFSYFFSGHRRDIDTYGDSSPESIMSHWILLFKAADGKGELYFSDPTFRQFSIGVNPDQMLVGVPAVFIEGIYGAEEIYCQKLAADPNEGRRYQPKTLQGVLFTMNLEAIGFNGVLQGVTEDEYLGLLEVFSDK